MVARMQQFGYTVFVPDTYSISYEYHDLCSTRSSLSFYGEIQIFLAQRVDNTVAIVFYQLMHNKEIYSI